jgi:hypothetical protein
MKIWQIEDTIFKDIRIELVYFVDINANLLEKLSIHFYYSFNTLLWATWAVYSVKCVAFILLFNI